MADRPRRSTRQATKQQQESSSSSRTAQSQPPAGATGIVAESLPTAKAKARRNPKAPAASAAADPEEWLKSLLTSSKSILTTIDISDIFNAGAWDMLSDESRCELKKLLPPTAFVGYQPSIGSDHPAAFTTGSETDYMDVDDANGANPESPHVDASALFTDPHFLAAARTFQDHIYSSWFSDAHREKVTQFEKELWGGTLAVPWKDDQWLEDNTPVEALPDQPAIALGRRASWNLALAGGATQVKLSTLVERGIVRVGDILAYRRNFTTHNLTIEKDVIVDSIDPKMHALTVLAVLGTTKALPTPVVVKQPSGGGEAAPSTAKEDAGSSTTTSIRSMSIISPSMLESALLDMDGRLDKSQRPNGNAWKTFSVWRWRTKAYGASVAIDATNENGRGGRENHGTLFYLRGNFYHEEF